MCLHFVLTIMWKSDFQTLVLFVRATEKDECSFSKDVNSKNKSRQLPTVCEKQGINIKNFYEDLVNADESVEPWSDSIKNRNTIIVAESFAYDNTTNSSRTCLKRKLDSHSSKKPPVASSSSTADTININCAVLKYGDNYKNKQNSLEMPLNCKPFICRNTDNIVKKISLDHIQNAVLRCAQDGDLPGLKKHLMSGSVDVKNCTDSFGWTPLMCASYSGHIDVVKFLLSLDGLNDHYRNQKGQSALELSAKGGHWHIKKLLESRQVPVSSSPTSHKEEESRIKIKSSLQKQPSKYFCDVCQMQIKNTTKHAHDSSTVHLLSCHPQPLPESYFLSEQNRGFQIMLRKGWDESKGLGPSGEGRRIPIKTILKHDRKGFGKKSSNVARVSHFDARDPNSVQYKQPRFKKGINKKKLASIQKREKIKERHLRRCLDFS